MNRNAEYLKQIRKLDLLIERKREFLERLEYEAVYKSPNNQEEGRGTKIIMDSMAEKACKIVDLKDELNESIDKLIDMKLEAMRAIDALDNADEIQVLYLRYFDYLPWDEIIHKMDRSTDWVFKLHRRALKKLKINFKNL